MNAGRHDELHPIELLAAVALGGVLLIALALGLVGGVAGLLFGDGWVWVPLSDMPSVLARLREHLGDPRDAWPRSAADTLPSAVGFYAALAIVVGAICTAAAVITPWLLGRHSRAAGSARWANAHELRSLIVRRPTRGRVTLGRHHGRLVAAEARQSVIVVAPTQTGKTTGLAVPALLEWSGPILATSVKNDLLHDTYARRARLGDVKVFDPSATTGLERASWTPLAACGDWQGARRTADRLAKAAQFSARTLQDADFWAHAGARFLAPMLLAAAVSERTMADVARWIDTEEQAEVDDALVGEEYEPARNALLTVWSADDRLRSSLYLTASLALDAYNDPTVAACSSVGEVTPEWLLADAANTLFLCAPADEQARLRPLFVTLIREVVAEVYARSSRTGKPIEPALLVVLDEAPNIAPVPDLDQIASTGSGQGLQLVTVVQDLAQVHARWGPKADSIINNHRAKLFGSGLSCLKTLDYVSRVLGDRELRQVSRTSGEHGRRSMTESRTFRSLAPANVLRESRPGSMLLMYGHLPPVRIALRPWFRSRALQRLADPWSGEGRADVRRGCRVA
jgi:type IV secretion system protein VirD4